MDDTEYTISKVRTNRLFCSCCDRKIKRGEQVVFCLVDGRMNNVSCESCASENGDWIRAIENSEHPYSEDSLQGGW